MTRSSPKLLLTLSKTTRLKWGWRKDAKYWLNIWGIQEEAIMQNINNFTNIITSKFKENMWCDKELVDKRKLRYFLGGKIGGIGL
jgi:hypothetical protein